MIADYHNINGRRIQMLDYKKLNWNHYVNTIWMKQICKKIIQKFYKKHQKTFSEYNKCVINTFFISIKHPS